MIASRAAGSKGAGAACRQVPPLADSKHYETRENKLPEFTSDDAETRFWSRHSIEEFRDEIQELDLRIQPPRTEQIALRLVRRDLDTLKKLAKRRGLGHTTLARSIVEQWLAVAQKSPRRRLRASANHQNG
jgi:predicted DNA binding CopG/RHH family protein